MKAQKKMTVIENHGSGQTIFHDIQFFPNTRPGIEPKVIFTCIDEEHAVRFAHGLQALIDEHVVDDVDWECVEPLPKMGMC